MARSCDYHATASSVCTAACSASIWPMTSAISRKPLIRRNPCSQWRLVYPRNCDPVSGGGGGRRYGQRLDACSIHCRQAALLGRPRHTLGRQRLHTQTEPAPTTRSVLALHPATSLSAWSRSAGQSTSTHCKPCIESVHTKPNRAISSMTDKYH